MSIPSSKSVGDGSALRRKRGAPVLIELLRQRPMRADMPMLGSIPAEQIRPERTLTDDGPAERSGPGLLSKLDNPRGWLILSSLALGVLVVVYLIASAVSWSRAESATTKKFLGEAAISGPADPERPARAPAPAKASEPTPDAGAARGSGPVTAPGSTVYAPGSAGNSRTGQSPNINQANESVPADVVLDGTSDLVPGMNYLVVAMLNRPDAEAAARFLTANAVRATIYRRGVDPRGSDANNGLWRVLVLQGMSKPLSEGSRKQALALQEQVRRLGARWRQDNRQAPTQFEQTFWEKFNP